MSIQNYSYNPFSLSTASSAWSEGAQPLLTRACKATFGAAHDLFIKNPYDITIGNCKTLASSIGTQPLVLSVTVAAGIAFGTLGSLMLYGSAIHLLGRGMLALSSTAGLVTMAKVAEFIQTFGINVFLTGAVPIYAIFYELPKQAILALPKFAQFLADKIAIVSNWIFQNLLQPMWTMVVVPAFQTIATVIRFVATQIKTVLDAVGRTIAAIAEKMFEYVIRPLFQKVIIPLFNKMSNAFHFVYRSIASVLEAIGAKVAQAAQWIIKNMIVPFWNGIIVPALQKIGDVIVYLAKGIANALTTIVQEVAQSAQWVFQHLIVPVWNNVLLPVLKAADNAFRFVANMVGQVMHAISSAVAKAATFVFQKIIAPVFNGIAQVLTTIGKLCNTYVIQPLSYVLKAIAEKVASAFKVIFDNLIVPTAKALATITKLIKDRLVDLTMAIHQSMSLAWHQVALRFKHLSPAI